MPHPELEHPDTIHLRAAIGWLELKNPLEAGRDIARIAHENLDHPSVLEVRWAICAEGKRWGTGAEIARKLTEVAPERSSGWIHLAYCLRRVRSGGGLEAAWDVLRQAYDKFPSVWIIPYNLACYAAQSGRKDEAWDWLRKSLDLVKDIDDVKQMALGDNDLKPLWERIRNI